MPHAFMQIPSIPKDLLDPQYNGWMNAKNISQGLSVEFEDFGKTRGRVRSVSKLTHEEMEVTRDMDKASLGLRIFCCQGVDIPEVNLALRRESDKNIYLKFEMKDCLVTGFNISVSDGDAPEETIKFHYREIAWSIRPKLPDGKMGAWAAKGWNAQDQTEVQVKAKKK